METREIIAKAGGARQVANTLGLSVQWVYKWDKVPPRHVKAVSRLSGIPPEKIRPDIW